MMAHAISRSTLRALTRYSELALLCAYRDHVARGEGPSSIGGGNVAKGNAMINAGRDLATGHPRPWLGHPESRERAERAFRVALDARNC